MSLLDSFLTILSGWKTSFSKRPSYHRASFLAISSLCVFGRACISRMICFMGSDQKDWSAQYKLFARAKWNPQHLFQCILSRAIQLIDEPYVAIAFDDTKLKKTGKKIKTAFYQRDPMSPPFHVNLMYGLRFLQGSLLVPLYLKHEKPPRSLPIFFQEVPALKKPGKNATEEEKIIYKQAQKNLNLSTYFRNALVETRKALDQAGAEGKILIATVDGSFCNRICMRNPTDRICIVARARKDAKLCLRAKDSKKIYASEKFTPEQIRQNDAIPWQTKSVFHGGRFREVRFKVVEEVLWERGTGRETLKLIVIAPMPYRLTKTGRIFYRDPAYLFCQASKIATEALIQKYFDRWQIEVNHREEKDTIGVGQAQVRSKLSVSRQPAFVVAAYSTLLLAGIICFEDKRGNDFEMLPKWRRKAIRPSCLDLIQLLRKEVDARKIIKASLAEAALKSAA